MNGSGPLGTRGVRFLQKVLWFGRGYLWYHILVATLMLFWFLTETRPGYWREPGALSELAFTVILYPLFIPALVTCGGPHACEVGPLIVISIPVFLVTLIAAGGGVALVFEFLLRFWSRSR